MYNIPGRNLFFVEGGSVIYAESMSMSGHVVLFSFVMPRSESQSPVVSTDCDVKPMNGRVWWDSGSSGPVDHVTRS